MLVRAVISATATTATTNHRTKERVDKVWKRMERLGIRPKRLQLEWVSAIEEQRWQEVMRRMEEVRILGNAVLPGPTLVAIDVHLIRPEFVP